MNRREFLKTVALTSGGLVLGPLLPVNRDGFEVPAEIAAGLRAKGRRECLTVVDESIPSEEFMARFNHFLSFDTTTPAFVTATDHAWNNLMEFYRASI